MIGFLFVAISYYAGVILLSLPVPHRGVKQAGRALVEEGAIAAVLLATVPSIPAIVNFITAMLYGEGVIDRAYEDLYFWLSKTSSYCVLANTVIAESLGLLAKLDSKISWLMPGIGFFGNLAAQIEDVLEPWTAAMAGTMVFSELLKRIALIIQAGWFSFIVIGAVLFALPKEVGRGAGVVLLSTGITYYIALPFLPAFVSAIAPGLLEQLTPIAFNPRAFGITGAIISKGQVEQVASNMLTQALGWGTQFTFLIWSRIFLPALFLTIVGLLAAGIGRVLGGRVPWLLTSIVG